MIMKRTWVVFGVLWLPALAAAADWEIDSAHSSVQFRVRHLMISNVRGEFDKVTGRIAADEKDITKSMVHAEIDVATLSTREPKRDEHLKSADFLDVQKYPTITFHSRKVAKGKKNRLKVVGDLTLHGVTKEVTLDVELTQETKDPWGGVRRGATATASFNRKDFGVSWNKALDTGGVMVGEEVAVEIDLELLKKAPAAQP